MKKKNGLFRTLENQERELLWNGKLNKMLGGTRVEFEEKELDFNDDIQKVLLSTTKGPLKELRKEYKIIFLDPSETVGYFNQGPVRGHPSRRDKYIRDNIQDEVYRNVDPPLTLPPTENKEEFFEIQGEEIKIIIPSNTIDICTRLEILIGHKLSGHTHTLTETKLPT